MWNFILQDIEWCFGFSKWFLFHQGQFHQCSTCSFCICKLRVLLFCAYILGLYFTDVSLPAQKQRIDRWWNSALKGNFSIRCTWTLLNKLSIFKAKDVYDWHDLVQNTLYEDLTLISTPSFVFLSELMPAFDETVSASVIITEKNLNDIILKILYYCGKKTSRLNNL